MLCRDILFTTFLMSFIGITNAYRNERGYALAAQSIYVAFEASVSIYF